MGGTNAKPVVPPGTAARYLDEEMKLIQTEFTTLATGKKVGKGEFMQSILKPVFWKSKMIGYLGLERITQVLAYEGNSSLSFDEFLVAQYLLHCSTPQERYRFIFSLFDLDGTGKISKKNFKKIAVVLMQRQNDPTRTKKFMPLADAFTNLIFATLDRNGDGTLNYIEWRSYAEEDDIIQQILLDLKKVPPLTETVDSA